MDILTRVIPTREAMVRDHEGALSERDLVSVDLALTLLLAADAVRKSVYGRYARDYGLSEGNIGLLMALSRKDGMGVIELAQVMGVSAATASMMLKRMLAREKPLVEAVRDGADARLKTVRLSARGRRLLRDRLLPGLAGDFREFASGLPPEAQEELLAGLRRLLSL